MRLDPAQLPPSRDAARSAAEGAAISLGLSRVASTRGSRGSHTCLDQGEPRLSHLVPTRDTLVPVAEFITCGIGFLEYMAYALGTVEENTRCLDSAAQRGGYKSRGGRRGFTPGTDTRHGSTAATKSLRPGEAAASHLAPTRDVARPVAEKK